MAQYRRRTYGSSTYEFDYWFKRTNHAVISLKTSGNMVYITAPWKRNIYIHDFIDQHLTTIKTKLDEYYACEKMNYKRPHRFIIGHGKKYKLRFTGTEPMIDHSLRRLCLPARLADTTNEIKQRKTIYQALIPLTVVQFRRRVHYGAKQLNLTSPKVDVKFYQAKWGLCYPQRRHIILNVKLVHFTNQVLDYIIIHELCHLWYDNHSQLFGAAVAKYYPNYKIIIKTLKTPGV